MLEPISTSIGEELPKIISTLNTTFKENFKVGFASRTTKCSHNLVPDFFCQFMSFYSE